MSGDATEIARKLRRMRELVYDDSLRRLMLTAADELERLHEVEHRGSGGQTGATTTDEPVVLWSRPGYERKE